VAADKNGVIDVSDISAKYSAEKHPDVISGEEMREGWGAKERDCASVRVCLCLCLSVSL
jgi:hypothetical protein